jgi:hypothetical protein
MAWTLGAIGGGIGAAATMSGARGDTAALRNQARVATQQATADEYAVRREGRQALGTMAASMAQAGGGQDRGILRQSAANAELDALNIRYGGKMRASGLMAEARNIKKQAPLLAAAQLLSGGSASYTAWKAR